MSATVKVFDGAKQDAESRAKKLYEELERGAPNLDDETLIDYCAQMLEMNAYLSRTLTELHRKVRDSTEMAISISLALKSRRK